MLASLVAEAGTAGEKGDFEQGRETCFAEFDYIYQFTISEIDFTLDNPVRRDGVRVINAKDHGLIGDGVADDGPALREMLRGVRDEKSVVLFFPRGTYLIETVEQVYSAPAGDHLKEYANPENLPGKIKDAPNSCHIAVEGFRNIEFRGDA